MSLSSAAAEEQPDKQPAETPAMVFVIEDHDDTRRLLQLLLSDSGFVTDSARDGESALAKLRDVRPNLVLLDYNLPGMNGLDVLKSIRDTPALRDVSVVMLTAVNDDQIRVEAQREGIDGFIQKANLNWTNLLQQISGFLDHPP